MEIKVSIRQLDDEAFRRECERFEREQRRRNFRDGILILLAIIIIQVLLGMAGAPIHFGPI